MLRIFSLVFFTTVVTIISLITTVHGFCIYNRMADYNFVAVQKYGYGREYMSKFSKIIKPGESACCHFENRDCNGGGTKDDLLVFSMYSEVDAGRAGIREVGMLAGGYLIVTGNPFMPNIDTFDANGNPFQYRS